MAQTETTSETERRSYVLIGTGNRGTTMWGRDLLAGWSEHVDLVAIIDKNELRARRARHMIKSNAPIFSSVEEMQKAGIAPQMAMVCTPDDTHDEIVVQMLQAGADIITEKPMTTTVEKIRRMLEAEARSGKRIDVSFNYRYSPTAARIKELLMQGAIGKVTSVDFHWYLDTAHGADYFRRWHAYIRHSGSLFVHKATHHFDLLNWYLDSTPQTVSAFGKLLNYGKNGPFRGDRCQTCPHTADCNYFFDISSDPFLDALYEDPAKEDGYFRDRCVFREDIDIPDTMVANIGYANDVQVSYSLNTFQPIEGHHIAFNGTRGRIELRQHEDQPWDMPDQDEILLIRNFPNDGEEKLERIIVPHAEGGHYGGDNRMRDMIFKPGQTDTLHQRAGARAGAYSVLCGIAALKSAQTGEVVKIDDLMPDIATS